VKKAIKYIMDRNNEYIKDGVFFINDYSIINLDMFIRRLFEAFRINYVISDGKQEFNELLKRLQDQNIVLVLSSCNNLIANHLSVFI
jgi:hypothetical protein